MAIRSIQQIMLGTVSRSESEAYESLKRIKSAGYDGIELNGFMIRPTPMIVQYLTKMAGMPVGRGGKFDWKRLVEEAGLTVTGIHTDLGGLEREPENIISEEKKYKTDKIIITGMYRFNYLDKNEVKNLAKRLNEAGLMLKKEEITLCYHNHNIEFLKVDGKRTVMDILIEETDDSALDFEADTYWAAEAGVDTIGFLEKLRGRIKLYHINDRGTKLSKAPFTPLLKSDSMELGYGNMPLKQLVEIALSEKVDAVVLETQKNWPEKSPLRSMEMSAEFMNKYVK